VIIGKCVRKMEHNIRMINVRMALIRENGKLRLLISRFHKASEEEKENHAHTMIRMQRKFDMQKIKQEKKIARLKQTIDFVETEMKRLNREQWQSGDVEIRKRGTLE
jgi:hypothetical protein